MLIKLHLHAEPGMFVTVQLNTDGNEPGLSCKWTPLFFQGFDVVVRVHDAFIQVQIANWFNTNQHIMEYIEGRVPKVVK